MYVSSKRISAWLYGVEAFILEIEQYLSFWGYVSALKTCRNRALPVGCGSRVALVYCVFQIEGQRYDMYCGKTSVSGNYLDDVSNIYIYTLLSLTLTLSTKTSSTSTESHPHSHTHTLIVHFCPNNSTFGSNILLCHYLRLYSSYRKSLCMHQSSSSYALENMNRRSLHVRWNRNDR